MAPPPSRARRGHEWSFDEVPFDVIDALAETLGSRFLEGRCNDAPSARALLDATRAARGRTSFGGHVVWPPRDDYRVTLTSVQTPAAGVPREWRASADEVTTRGRSVRLWWD